MNPGRISISWWSRITTLRAEGRKAKILSPRELRPLTSAFARDTALSLLQAGHVLIFAGGTGNPYFTTDSAAALRALEISADVLVKGTQVDGVYDKDPAVHPDAARFDRVSYLEVLQRGLRVMDSTAVSLCMDNGLPILVFKLEPGACARVVCGEGRSTWVGPDEVQDG